MTKKGKVVPISEAQMQLGQQVKGLRPGEPVVLQRHGKPVAGLVSVEDLQNLQRAERGTSVLMAFNHAGGAAKTSTIRDLGYELAQLGYRVLLLDIDPQANLTNWLGVLDAPVERSLQPVLEDYAPLPEPYPVHGMDLIPSHLSLARTDARLPGYTNAEGRLRAAIEQVRGQGTYDFVLIDPPPSLGKLTANAANAADWVIVPVPARYKGIVALEGLREMLGEYTRTNPGLRVAMYLVTQMENTAHSKESHEVFQQVLGDQLAGPLTYRPAMYNRCQPEGQPIGVNAPDSDARREIQGVVAALLQRIGRKAE
ncbi:type II toxin-antitoxin system prevent-host-death family antitoxin [Deinococcus aestuarii]|uniref:type II toxin-antitoxin system prevent-host-death family antitoxin n=1 Tax=Deinococcus aestuarii TaxID=2774531 RepID=UPI001C0AFA62|nr:type II toxin-antitoxin system prevent-host-death family antitoxin [Deinococcus aestuarii]